MQSQDDLKEQDVEFLASMTGGDVGLDQARKVLWKHRGNVQKAVDAILGGDRGEDDIPSWDHLSHAGQNAPHVDPSSSILPAAPQTTPTSSSIIDLTSEDDEMTRALQLSMERPQNETTFGPSNRAPDPAWQMVPSNTSVAPVTQEDRSLKDAIQASLKDFDSDELELFPVEETVREGGRPVALRPEEPSIAYAALVIQALFFVPQVRESVAKLELPHIDLSLPRDSPERAILNLVELFVNLDLARLSSIVDKEVLRSLAPPPWNGSTETLGDLTTEFIKTLGCLIESNLNAQKPEDEPEIRLFHFFHGVAEIRGKSYKFEKSSHQGSVVTVDIGDSPIPNDLITRLSRILSRPTEKGSSHDVIIEPSQLVMFQPKWLHNDRTSVNSSKSSSDAFMYPKFLYLDQFLAANLRLTEEKRTLEQQLLTDIDTLTREREFITHHDNRDTLKDLRASLYYYENVAESEGDPGRKEANASCASELKRVLTMLTNKVDEINHKIESLQADVAVLFDCPELQKHRYDLRAVLMHTGLPGRKQIYSYIQDNHGVWWKILDHSVTEVPEETVLTDPTGLHLSAGPYMLIYSRHIPDQQMMAPITWPKLFTDSVEENNRTFLLLLPPELAAKAQASVNLPVPPSPLPSSQTETQTHSGSTWVGSSMDITNE